ncbi:MAG: hypothetical protein R3296_01455 [Oleiphilaceae bacterium]|nr:hypothetical protein [Oleiphilaceae bacterium]
MHLFFGLLLTLLLFLLLRQWQQATPEQRRRGLFYAVVSGVAVLSLVLVVTGRVHFLAGLVMAALPWLRRVAFLRRLRALFSAGGGAASAGEQAREAPVDDGPMTLAQARELLGVTATASREEIVMAHRRLMQRVHPDRGGDNALAARANEAKALLLRS